MATETAAESRLGARTEAPFYSVELLRSQMCIVQDYAC